MTELVSVPEFISSNIDAVRARIARACDKVGRSPDEITLVAVSKTVASDHIRAAMACGVTHFGENRVQDAQTKVPELPKELNWHLIGSLQRNKVKPALSLFSCIHSIDRSALVETLARHPEAASLPVLMQVNISGEHTKRGVSEGEAPGLARLISTSGLSLVGLMTIAPYTDNPEEARPVFRQLRLLALRLQEMGLPGASFGHLSMGMSGDLEVAVEEGATIVRVGSSIFGQRST